MDFSTLCLRFLEEHVKEISNPDKMQNAVFKDIVLRNKETAFAKDKGFSKIRTFDEFREAIPITTYQDYESYIHKSANGESNQLSVSPPYMWLKTSGTTGKTKIIPQNMHWRINYRAKAIYSQWGLYEKLYPHILSNWGKVMDISWQRKIPSSFFGKLPYQSITNRQASISENDWLPPWYNCGWFVASDDSLLQHLEKLLRHFFYVDVQCIVVVNPSTIILLDQILRDQSAILLEEAYASGWLDNSYMANIYNDTHYRKLRILIKRQGYFDLNDLWPNIKFISCWKSAGASLYINSIKDKLPNTQIIPFSALGTEGVVAIPIDNNSDSIPLAVNHGLYEFLPKSQLTLPNVIPLKYNELKVGETYQLITTQANGLYRYNTEDLYLIDEYHNGTPRIEFVGRGSSIHSFTGEKISEMDIIETISALEQETNRNFSPFYCVPVWDSPPYYSIFLEISSEHLRDENLRYFAEKIDQILCKVNEEYKSKRISKRLGMPVVKLACEHSVKSENQASKQQEISGLQKKHKIMKERISASS